MDLSVLYITYNRSDLLLKSIRSFIPTLTSTKLKFEVIVTDDASTIEHVQTIKLESAIDKFISSESNGGLGVNTNRGLNACAAPIILQLQDDWIFAGQHSDLTDVLQVMQSDPEIGIIQLTDNCSFDLPTERRLTSTGIAYEVFTNDRLPWNRDCGLRPYSDCPHIKSALFVKYIGPYLEGISMGVTENDFKRRVATQGRWRVAKMCREYIFIHIGAEHSLNPGGNRHRLIVLLHKIPVIGKAIESLIRKSWRYTDHILRQYSSLEYCLG